MMIDSPLSAPHEEACLRLCIGVDLGCLSPDELPPAFANINWQHLLWAANRHGLLWLLAEYVILPRMQEICPAGVYSQLQAVREVIHFKTLSRTREILKVYELFETAGIPAVCIEPWNTTVKSGTLVFETKVDSQRQSLFFAVPESRRSDAETTLQAHGHTVKHDAQALVLPGSSPVILDSCRLPSCDTKAFWDGTVEWSLGGRKLKVLGQVQQLLQLCLRSGESSRRLGEAWRIAACARSLSKEERAAWLAEAERLGIRSIVATRLASAHRSLKLPLPAPLNQCQDDEGSSQGVALGEKSRSQFESLAAPYLPTTQKVLERMIALAEITSTDQVMDLGCGDGRLVVQAALKTGASGFGIDLNPIRVQEALALAEREDVSARVHFVCGDIFDADISAASVLFLYLLPVFYPRIQEELLPKGRAGLRIVSHDYCFPDWKPERCEIVRWGPMRYSIVYLWRLSGRDDVPGGEGS